MGEETLRIRNAESRASYYKKRTPCLPSYKDISYTTEQILRDNVFSSIVV